MQSPEHGKVLEKWARTPKMHGEMCIRVWGTGVRILVLFEALVLAGMHLASATAYHRKWGASYKVL